MILKRPGTHAIVVATTLGLFLMLLFTSGVSRDVEDEHAAAAARRPVAVPPPPAPKQQQQQQRLPQPPPKATYELPKGDDPSALPHTVPHPAPPLGKKPQEDLGSMLPYVREHHGARAAQLTDLFTAMDKRADKCALPVVCQVGACVAAPGAADGGDCKGFTLPALNAQLRAGARTVVMEVGTNLVPETTKLAARRGLLRVAVEPLRAEGSVVWGMNRATVLVSAAVATTRGVAHISLMSTASALRTDGGGDAGGSQRTAMVPLAEVIDEYVPATATAQFLVVDVQGLEVPALLSAGRAGLRRFQYVIFECQELHEGHPFRMSADAPTCLSAITTISAASGLRLAGCIENVALFEHNCLLAHPDAPGASRLAAAHNYSDVAAVKAAARMVPEWRVALNVSRRPGNEQLGALIGAQAGADAYELMCPVTLSRPWRAPSKCVVRREAELLAMKSSPRARHFWELGCKQMLDKGEPAAAVHACFARRALHFPGHGACQTQVLACDRKDARCIESSARSCKLKL